VLAHGGECCGVHANGVRSLDGLLIDVDAGYMHSAWLSHELVRLALQAWKGRVGVSQVCRHAVGS
jgi:hypothetical protein